MIVSVPATFVIYDLGYGLLMLATQDDPITLGHAVSRGAAWAIVVAIVETARRLYRETWPSVPQGYPGRPS